MANAQSISITHQVKLRGLWKQLHVGPTALYSILEVYFIPNFSFGQRSREHVIHKENLLPQYTIATFKYKFRVRLLLFVLNQESSEH